MSQLYVRSWIWTKESLAIVHFLCVQRHLVLSPAPGIEVGVSGDLIHPGREPVSGLERMAVFQHAQKNVVNQIFAGLSIAGEADKEAKERCAMAVIEDAQLFHFAVPNPQHQQLIGG